MPLTEEIKEAGPVVRIIYRVFLREMIKKAINDPDETWDDMVLKILDAVMGYKEPFVIPAGSVFPTDKL